MLEDTGERVIPEKMKITNELLIEHVARYHFAREHAYGRVLDFACGSGYGAHIIIKKSKGRVNEVVGVDIDLESVKYAKATYFHHNSTFMEADVTDPELPEKLGQFDCILSFETIEHIEDEKRFLSNIYRMLKPGGTLIMSTPFGEGRGVPSGYPFHVHQLTKGEFRNLFEEYTSSEFYFQKGALIMPADFGAERNRGTGSVSRVKHYPVGIAVCRK
ncbi:class I SAM-dependent methyltransferase [Virgibacillus kekensis]|uniref:Class I SAM-dependent methyltransferase n=1 Tax=Virgibacillus kekensis TaxID=202261 RepID=A0ABV9DHU3_9BACI